jgi:hypothetical protein
MRPMVVEPRGLEQFPGTGHGYWAACCGVGPSRTLSEPSGSSILPAQNPMEGPPMTSMATVPVNMIRSPQDSASPYLFNHVFNTQNRCCRWGGGRYLRLMGHSKRFALSRLVLSSQLRSGSNLWRPPSQPPRPSYDLCSREPVHDRSKRSKLNTCRTQRSATLDG